VCIQCGWQLLTAGIGVALLAAGWKADARPADEVIFRRDGHELRPFSELNALLAGRSSRDAWGQRCRALGIYDLPLARTEKA
jgi:hypothetical protein